MHRITRYRAVSTHGLREWRHHDPSSTQDWGRNVGAAAAAERLRIVDETSYRDVTLVRPGRPLSKRPIQSATNKPRRKHRGPVGGLCGILATGPAPTLITVRWKGGIYSASPPLFRIPGRRQSGCGFALLGMQANIGLAHILRPARRTAIEPQ